MTLLRIIGRIILWICAGLGGLMVAGILVAALSWWWLPELDREIPESAVIELNIADGISETAPDSPLAWAARGRTIILPELVESLADASRDPRVRGLVARLGSGDIGLAQAQEIRDAVLEFRRQGKFAVAFAETFGEAGDGNIHYYLATAFDSIYMQPSGSVDLTGFLLQSPYAKEALDSLGVTAEMDRRREFKSALETFTRDAMSDAAASNLQQLVDSWARQLAAGIAATRPGIDEGRAMALIDGGPYLAEDARRLGLVDNLSYWNAVDVEVDSRSAMAERIALNDYIDARPAPPEDAPLIALIHGLGPVALAPSERDPLFGSVTMGSHTVADALRQAIEDTDVAAIVFRVDSPGGSYVASDTIWAEVKRAREQGKPLVVSMGNVAASGGYFVAAAAEEIVAEPGTITGSIGVFGGKFVFTGLWDRLGINWDGVQAGANADMASPNEPYDEAGWARLQQSLDFIYQDFTAKVAQGRGLPPEQVETVAQGKVWTGAEAAKNGLVDALGGYATAIARAKAAAGIDLETPVRVAPYPERDRGLGELLAALTGSGLVDQGARAQLAVLARLAALLEPVAEALAPLGTRPEERTLRMPELYPAR